MSQGPNKQEWYNFFLFSFFNFICSSLYLVYIHIYTLCDGCWLAKLPNGNCGPVFLFQWRRIALMPIATKGHNSSSLLAVLVIGDRPVPPWWPATRVQKYQIGTSSYFLFIKCAQWPQFTTVAHANGLRGNRQRPWQLFFLLLFACSFGLRGRIRSPPPPEAV